MGSGIIQGLLGGLGVGLAQSELERDKQQHAQDIADRERTLNDLEHIMSMPNLRSGALGTLFDLYSKAEATGTGKKGKAARGDVMAKLAELLKQTDQPLSAQEQKQADPTGRGSREAQQQAQVRSDPHFAATPEESFTPPPAQLPPVPHVPGKTSLFTSPQEQMQQETRAAYEHQRATSLARAPEVEAQIRLRADETRETKRQEAQARSLQRQQEWGEKFKYLGQSELQRAERRVKAYAATLDPSLDDATKEQLARNHENEYLNTVLENKKKQGENLNSQIKTRQARLANDLTRINIALRKEHSGTVKSQKLSQLRTVMSGVNAEINQYQKTLADFNIPDDDPRKQQAREKVDALMQQHEQLRQQITDLPDNPTQMAPVPQAGVAPSSVKSSQLAAIAKEAGYVDAKGNPDLARVRRELASHQISIEEGK